MPYAVAVGVTAAAAFLRWLLDPWLGSQMVYIPFVVAIIAAGWRGGARPAALAAVLSGLLALYLFVPPRLDWLPRDVAAVLGLVLFALGSALAVTIIASMHAARRRVQQQSALLRTTLASIGDAVLTTDARGQVDFLNPEAERLTGWSGEEARGQPLTRVLRLVEEQTGAPAADAIVLVLRRGRQLCLVNAGLLIARDGSTHPVDDSAAPIRDEGGRVCGMVLVLRDVTARRQAERARQEAQEHVIATLESIPDAFLRVGADWRIEYVNNQYERGFGRARASQAGRLLWDEWPELLATAAERRLRRAMAERRLVEFESQHAQWNRWFAVKACPVHDRGLAIFVRDITDRKRAERARRLSEERFRLAAEAVNGLIYDFDPASGHVARSQGLFDLLGYRPDEVPPTVQWWWEQIHPQDRRELEQYYTPPMLYGRGVLVYRVRHKDGHDVWVSDRSLTVRDGHGRVVRQVGCSIDISALKEAEFHLKEADRRKDEFLATLAHELRNPLAPISNAVQILKAKAAFEPSASWGLGVIERQAQTMGRLLDDLLDVSRIARNKLELRREPVELASVLQQAVETSRPFIDMGGHELTVTLPPDPVQLDADPVRLAQVFSNLLTNAAKYTPGGGHIQLAAARQDEHVRVSVRDDGIGIAPETLPRLFEIFSQAAPALERAQGGLGIGLSLVKGLVELHGGSIQASSEGIGHGSEFVVVLPVRARQALPAAGLPVPAGRELRRRRVLVADDNRDGADTLELVLAGLGHEVSKAYDGEQALALAMAKQPEVAVLDIGMPGKNGYEVCRAIRATDWGREATLIALTGWGQEGDRQRASEVGFDHHLVKPVDPRALAELVAQARQRTA
jgi:PAS domain S-box-containing protein